MSDGIKKPLPEPDEAMVRHAIRELDFAERLEVHKMNPATGNESISVYKFPAAVDLIFETRWSQVSPQGGNHAGIAWVDLGRLVAWVRDTIGDTDFADALSASTAGTSAYKAQMDAMRPVFMERIAQYKAVLAAHDTSEAS